MTDEEFFALPPHIAVRVLFECLGDSARSAVWERPKLEAPRRAKYDAQIHGKSGFQWASETSLESLHWWHKRALDSVAEGGDWVAKNQKQADNLAKWIAWREWYPDAAWNGTRGESEVVAAPPSGRPRIHPRAARSGNGQQGAAPQQDDASFDPNTF